MLDTASASYMALETRFLKITDIQKGAVEMILLVKSWIEVVQVVDGYYDLDALFNEMGES